MDDFDPRGSVPEGAALQGRHARACARGARKARPDGKASAADGPAGTGADAAERGGRTAAAADASEGGRPALALFGRRIRLPRRRARRLALGLGLVAGGLLGFLPVLGFWMIPLGLAVLAVDVPGARRIAARARAALARRRQPTSEKGDGDGADGE